MTRGSTTGWNDLLSLPFGDDLELGTSLVGNLKQELFKSFRIYSYLKRNLQPHLAMKSEALINLLQSENKRFEDFKIHLLRLRP